jgi:hypothetical protein
MTKRFIPPSLPPCLAGFTPIQLNERWSLYKAAQFNGFKDPGAFERNYPHLVRRAGKKKKFLTLYDVLMLPPPPPGWKAPE